MEPQNNRPQQNPPIFTIEDVYYVLTPQQKHIAILQLMGWAMQELARLKPGNIVAGDVVASRHAPPPAAPETQAPETDAAPEAAEPGVPAVSRKRK